MSDTVIRAENLGKKYFISHKTPEQYVALRDVIANKAKSLTQNIISPFIKKDRHQSKEDFWALKDVSFEVKQGEILGIIGRNGAGKTTLLKILSRITVPSTGLFTTKGRVASLLEVGTGFHPELTGRENIYLNGAILGMHKTEIKSKFDEIVAFAEIDKFLDTPLKRYSSGMYVRLAFSVAAHLEPEILLVDEVLAVGDAAFQKKCLGKMANVNKEGRTILFVSHNMDAIRSSCQKALYIDSGYLKFHDVTEKVIHYYHKIISSKSKSVIDTTRIHRTPDLINNKLRITSFGINNSKYQATLYSDKPLSLFIEFMVFELLYDVVFGLSVHSVDNIQLFQCRSVDQLGPIKEIKPGHYRIEFEISKNPLNPGDYSFYLGSRCASIVLDYLPNVMTFRVELSKTMKSPWFETRSGYLSIEGNWSKPTRI